MPVKGRRRCHQAASREHDLDHSAVAFALPPKPIDILAPMRKQCPWASLLAAVLPLCLAAQDKPCKPTVAGHLDVFSLASATLHTTRNVRVWLPPGYNDPANAAKKYPVLYLLDGESAFDACTAFKHDEVHADETLTELIASGRIPPVIAVGIDSASPILADGKSKG